MTGQERESLDEREWSIQVGPRVNGGVGSAHGPEVGLMIVVPKARAEKAEAALAAREEPRFDQVTIGREEFEQIRRAQGFALFVAALDKPVAVTTRRKMTLERLIEKANDALSGVVGGDTERPDNASLIEMLREENRPLTHRAADALEELAAREEAQGLREAANGVLDHYYHRRAKSLLQDRTLQAAMQRLHRAVAASSRDMSPVVRDTKQEHKR